MFVAIILIGLIVAVMRLWKDLARMREQVRDLENRLDMATVTAAPPSYRTVPDVARVAVEPDISVVVPDESAPIERPPLDAIVEMPPLAEKEETPRASGRPGFEELFGRRLPIWGGGITLAVAGMLIVKYSIDAGLLSPLVRVILGMVFGTVLIGAAEAALRFADRVGDVRIRQALAGAGISSLYASVLVATNLYHLIAPVTAFAGLAAVTALAMGLSLRFGAPSALLGLVGGLAAPALVGSSEPNIPLLATYLAVAIGGLCAVSRSQRWTWLGISALIGGFGWGALLLVGGGLDMAASLSIGLYLTVIGILFPMLLFATDRRRTLIRFAGSAVAAIQIAVLVAKAGFALLDWGLFGMISIAIIWMSRREATLTRLPRIGLVIMILLLGAWPMPDARDFGIVMIVAAAIYALPLLWSLWRDGADEIEAAQIATIALGGLFLPLIHFNRADGGNDHFFATLAFVAALLPVAAAMLGWNREARHADARFALLTTTSWLLLVIGQAFVLPSWAWAPVTGLLALALLFFGFAARDRRLEYAAWVLAGIGLILFYASPDAWAETARATGMTAMAEHPVALLRWTESAIIAALFAWRGRIVLAGIAAQSVAALLAYSAIAQIIPADYLALLAASGLLGIAFWTRSLTANRLLPAMTALFATSLAWALAPFGKWVTAAVLSLFGFPLLTTALPGPSDVALHLLGPALLIAGAITLSWRTVRREIRMVAIVATVMIGGSALHIFYKHLFLLSTFDVFVQRGFAERTVWEDLMIAGALIVRHYGGRFASLSLSAAALGHFVAYSLLLHNPLWAPQAVGGIPMLNWLLPAYTAPMILLLLGARSEPALASRYDRTRSIVQVVLILVFAFSCLRQIAHGTILSTPGVTDAEDIARSIGAIVIAIGFLLWGIRRHSRDWRIASLMLMLGAIGKVFLFDASGLDGLARIGSFVALGLSLIGIGWLYSRFLKPEGSS